MIDQVITFFTHLIIQTISTTGYVGIFILMALESALIPIPSEITMPFSGYLVTTSRFNLYLVILIGALANLAGSIAAYLLGYWGQEHIVRKIIRNYGKYLLISEREFDKSEKWFRQHGEKIVFVSRVLPVVRTFISLPAGIAQMNFIRFSILTFLGSLIWSSILTYMGFVLGKNWISLEPYYRKFEILIFVFGIGVVGYYIWHKFKQLKKS